MEKADILNRQILTEITFNYSRSSGSGGQNVNKVNTKAELRFNVKESKILSDEEKQIILTRAKTYINNDGEIIIVSQKSRSQLENKEICIEKFIQLIEKWTKLPKNRIKTKPSNASIEKRLAKKSRKSEIKNIRNYTHDTD